MTIQMTRRPAVAGQFYPAEPDRLRTIVHDYLAEANVTPAPDKVAALVVPHAGFMFSGATAAHAYARTKGKSPNRIVLMGCSHRAPIATASVYDKGAFLSPLGRFPVDEKLAGKLAQTIGSEAIEPHLLEHALEVQLPFIAEVLGIVPLVPILFGGPIGEWHGEVADTLVSMLDKDDLVVASTDLSHYLSENEANRIDKKSIDAVLQRDWKAFAEGANTDKYALCGATAVAVAMAFADKMGATEYNLLDYRTSAYASGDTSRVVGYATISMERP